MGAFMALLSFAAFLVFALSTVSLQRASLLDKFRNFAAEHPDPLSQRFAIWVATSEGFFVFMALTLALAFAIFLIAGAVSGAFITRAKKRPMSL
jgi:ribose/xylose/arabinose/galactoside ABC-type transport system permease subunit